MARTKHEQSLEADGTLSHLPVRVSLTCQVQSILHMV